MVEGDFPWGGAGEEVFHREGLADLVDVRQQGDQGGVQGAFEARQVLNAPKGREAKAGHVDRRNQRDLFQAYRTGGPEAAYVHLKGLVTVTDQLKAKIYREEQPALNPELRAEITRRLAKGMTDQEIREAFARIWRLRAFGSAKYVNGVPRQRP